MSQDRLLQEAQLIGENFSFWATGEDFRHLFGYVYETPDVNYQVDIKFSPDFPQEPPQLIYSDIVTSLLGGTTQLDALASWTPESRVVDVLLELRLRLQEALTQPKSEAPSPLPAKPVPAPTQPEGSPATSVGSDAAEGGTAPPPESEPGTGSPTGQASTASAGEPPGAGAEGQPGEPAATNAGGESGSSGEYVTPDLSQYPDDGSWTPPPDTGGLETWTEEELSASQGQPQMFTYDTSADQPGQGGTAPSPSSPGAGASPGGGASAGTVDSSTGTSTSEPDAPPAEASVAVTEQQAKIQQWFAVDTVSPGVIQVYMTIPTGQTYLIGVDFRAYPEKPALKLPAGVAHVIGDPEQTLESLANWTPGSNPSVLVMLQQLETRLFSLQDMEMEERLVQGEFDAHGVPDTVGVLEINLITLGFKKFSLEVDLSPYPNRPQFEYSPELKEFLGTAITEIKAYQGWRNGETHTVDVLRELQWLVEKNSRLDLELQLLKSGIKDVEFEPAANTVTVKLAGSMKTKDLTFEFQVRLPGDYPSSPPSIDLLTDLEAQPEIAKKIEASMKNFATSWNTFSYLIDLFNKVSKMIFEVSVVTCILCHKIECPTCGKKLAAPSDEETCMTQCPHCERVYHAHCWKQTIASFGKCGFCMRPPPPGFDPDPDGGTAY